MSISLEKKAEAIGRILLTKGVKVAPIMRVGIACDISGSMARIIARGDLQKAFNQMMGVSYKFDDNGELDVFKFDDRCEYVGTSTPNDFENYIRDNNITERGGTCYSPIVSEVHEFFFKAKKKGGFLGFGGKTEPVNDMPVLMLILTDGEPNGESYATTSRAFANASSENVYFHLVGVGGSGRSSFPTIARLADELDNVGEVYLNDFNMSDEEVYDQLICDELVEWIKTHEGSNPQTASA